MGMIGVFRVPYYGDPNSKVVFVGEAPGAEEERQLQPFVGESGNKLTTVLGRHGWSRDEVYLTNLCMYRPEKNDFKNLIGSEQLKDGIRHLHEFLLSHRPNVVCALGNWPLYTLTGKHGKTPGSGIFNYRGSILNCHLSGLEGLKVIPTIHPAAILRDGSLYPLFDQDIARVKADSAFPELRLPERELNVVTDRDPEVLELVVQKLLKAEKLAVDIETFKPHRLACVGFADSPKTAYCIVWSENALIRDAIYRLLSSNIPKITHFGSYDTEVLHLHGFPFNNWWWDTMVGQHVMWPELPRALKTLVSIYTREPYYKNEAKEDSEDQKSWGPRVNKDRLWKYNCKDDACTFEVQEEQEKEMNEGPKAWRDFFNFEMEMMHVASEIDRTGMLRDEERRKLLEKALVMEWAERQGALNEVAGFNINAGSHTQVKKLLYERLMLPPRYNKKNKLTSDVDALVSLIQFATDKMHISVRESTRFEWGKKALAVKLVMLVRRTRKTLSSYILTRCSDDGRLRSLYKVPATETGRWSAEKYVDGSGLNGQTIPRDDVEIPDELIKDSTSVVVPPEVLPSEDESDDEGEGDSDSDDGVLVSTGPNNVE